MNTLEEVKKHLRPGQVYRRADLTKWSRSVDRHLSQLVTDDTLVKLRQGVYLYPKQSRFGKVPADPDKLVRVFLKDDDFLLTSPNDYNALGVGTTQLYNLRVVYNHKRHGKFKLGGQTFDFRVKPRYPKKVTPEFLLVDILNNLENLAEDRHEVLERVKMKLPEMNSKRLRSAVKRFAKLSAKKYLENMPHGI
ncbi:MAG: hypothetical protein U9R57_03375 [Thermodesulfobacteriota bacterium]|nr:hypothetical protein [Thermodesulfobacteriota bacterium]